MTSNMIIQSSDHPVISPAEFASLLEPLSPNPSFAVAVSGGADSMALCLLAEHWARTHGGRITALTVNHGLRPESTAEAVQVRSWLEERGIGHQTLVWQHGPLKGNIQEKAREARYRLLADWCREHSMQDLLVAHTLDDQTETLLLRLKRGSHIEGLAAMRPASVMHGIRLLRPLLTIPKARLAATLQASEQPWIEDPGNRDSTYDRARLRALLAALPDRDALVACLAATAEKLGALRALREAETRAFLQAHARLLPDGSVECDASALSQAAPDLALRALSSLLRQVGGEPHPPRFLQLERLYEALRRPGARRRTLHGCLVSRRDTRLLLRREHA